MKLNIHANALQSINMKSEDIFNQIVEVPSDAQKPPQVLGITFSTTKTPKKDEVFTISGMESVNSFRFQYTTPRGEFMAFIYDQEKHYGLPLEIFNTIDKLIKEIYKNVKKYVHINKLTEITFNWFKEKLTKSTSLSLSDYSISEIEPSIQEYEVWIPLLLNNVNVRFVIGDVTIKSVKKKDIEHLPIKLQEMIIHNHNSVAITKVEAEPVLATEIAFEKAEKAVGVLRFFLAIHYLPLLISNCALAGTEAFSSKTSFVFKDKTFITSTKSADPNMGQEILITANYLKEIDEKLGLGQLSYLLTLEDKTDFHNQLLNSVSLFSKAMLTRNILERMVYIITSIESFLLKNSSEPIQKNVGERMAIIIGKDLQHKKDIIENFTESYSFRSQMFHHGKMELDEEKKEMLHKCMLNIWLCLQHLVANPDEYPNKLTLINAVEDAKLSGEPFFKPRQPETIEEKTVNESEVNNDIENNMQSGEVF